MALAFEVVYTFQDESGDLAECAIPVPSTFNITQYTEFAQGMAQLVDAIVGGVVYSAGLRVVIDVSGLTSNSILSYSDVNDVGAFQFRTADGRTVDVNLPGYDEIYNIAGSDDIDQTDPDIAAFITAMEDGIAVTLATIEPCDIAEDDITSVVYARERFRS